MAYQRHTQTLWYHCSPHLLQVTKVMASWSAVVWRTHAGRNSVPRDTRVTLQSDPSHRTFWVGVPSRSWGSCLSLTPHDEYSSLCRWSTSLAISSTDILAKTYSPRLPPRRPHRRWPFLGFVKLATLPLMQALYLASFARCSAWMCTSMTRAAHPRHRGGCAVLLPSASLEVSGLRAPRRSWMHFVLKANSEESLQGEGYPGKWWQEFLTALRGWAKLTPKTNHQLPAMMSPLLP